jgi:AcrR family transcriptional regulator
MVTKRINQRIPPLSPPRVRRGNVADQQALRQSALDAAMRLFQAHGLAGVTMRAVATEVGVSAMALYRYFPNKAGLLRGLWEFAITELHGVINAAINRPGLSARQRLRAGINAFLAYYEARPDYYRLIFMTEQTYVESVESKWSEAPIYQEVMQTSQALTRDVAQEIGGDPARARLASDLRFALSTGYLHARLINIRYPWESLDALRTLAVEQIATAAENCVLAKG